MKAHRALFILLLLACCEFALGQSQVPPPESVSSDDISVADGLQLPTYGHVWALDTWKGLHELIRLRPPDTTGDESGFSLKVRRNIDFKGEAAVVRLHDASPAFFVRGVSGSDAGRSDVVAVRLNMEGQHRVAPKDTLSLLKQQAKRQTAQGGAPSAGIVEIKQQRVGATDWYQLSLPHALAPGEYALIPLPVRPALPRAKCLTLPSIRMHRKMLIRCARNSIAARHESDTPITQRC